MICLYNKVVFRILISNKLGFRSNQVTFLEITESDLDDIIKKYKPLYPTEPFREYGKGQGIPKYHFSSAWTILEKDEDYLNALKLYNRNKSLEDLES